MPRGGRDIPPASRRSGSSCGWKRARPWLQLEDYKQGLHQILGNFVRNAVKFTTKGSITIGFSQRPGWVRFYVRDTGIGIPEPKNATRSSNGSTRSTPSRRAPDSDFRSARASRSSWAARIGVDSAVGEGSCFRVEMPIAEYSPRRLVAAAAVIGGILHDFQIFFISLRVVGKRMNRFRQFRLCSGCRIPNENKTHTP